MNTITEIKAERIQPVNATFAITHDDKNAWPYAFEIDHDVKGCFQTQADAQEKWDTALAELQACGAAY